MYLKETEEKSIKNSSNTGKELETPDQLINPEDFYGCDFKNGLKV